MNLKSAVSSLGWLLGRALKVLGAAFVMFLLVLTFISAVSPQLLRGAESDIVIAFLAIMCLFTVVGIAASPVFATSATEAELITSQDSCKNSFLPGIVNNLRVRSNRLRLMAWSLLAVMFVLILVYSSLFMQLASQRAVALRDNQSTIDRLLLDRNLSPQALEYLSGQREPPLSLALGGATVGSLLLLLFLLRTISSIYQYNIRLAAFYDARADYLQLAGSIAGMESKELLELVAADKYGVRWTIEDGLSSILRRRQDGASNPAAPPAPRDDVPPVGR